MGSRTFCFIKKESQTPEMLKEAIKELAENSKQSLQAVKDLLLSFTKKSHFVDVKAQRELLELPLFSDSDNKHYVLLIYSEASAWMSLFETGLCEGNIVNPSDMERLSKIFHSPVLTISHFDKDDIYVSYCDFKSGVSHYHKRMAYELNTQKSGAFSFDEGIIDPRDFINAFSDELGIVDPYEQAFPEFLLDFCSPNDHAVLRDAWDAEEYSFIPDKIDKICSLLDLVELYNTDDTIPEGYTAIYD